MQKNTVILVGSLIVAGAIGVLKALQPLEPTWSWVTSALAILPVVATYFTVPGTQAQRDAHKAAS